MTSPEKQRPEAPQNPSSVPAVSPDGRSERIDPDLDFIRTISRQSGDSLKKCIQCGTCSATCELSPDSRPFPRKEMAWAVWGMKDRLLADLDVWLCHQCNDCSVRCPRGARPGDVLAAIRQQGVARYAVPRFLGRWANKLSCVPLLLGIPVALLTVVLYIGNLLGGAESDGERIIFPFYNKLPHWLLNVSFAAVSTLVLAVMVAGVLRFWRAMKIADGRDGDASPLKSPPVRAPAVRKMATSVLRKIITHDDFAKCTRARLRFYSHMSVLFGFLALALVAVWVVTAKINPLIPDGLIYPFGFWHPWKILANLGGLAVLGGCLWMVVDRLSDDEYSGAFSDWTLIATLLAVVITGFISEILHFLRLEPHRHVAYFAHLIFVLTLLMYLPYSKLAHLAYRTTALIYAEYSGRNDKTTARSVGPEEES